MNGLGNKTVGLLLLFGFLGSVKASLAQPVNPNEWNHWYFGPKQAVRFDSDPPATLSDSEMASWENSATISDSLGNLLLYSEGDTVWNGDHNVIGTVSKDSVKRQFSCWSCCIILRKPGQDSLYYIFTVPSQEAQRSIDTTHFKFAVANVKANQGKGEVIQKDKEVHKIEDSDFGNAYHEKIGFVRHSTKNAWWILTKDEDLNFITHLFDENGLHEPGVQSSIKEYYGGYVSFDPDGKKMVTGNSIYKFNPETGEVIKKLASLSGFSAYHAISPNGDYLYFKGSSGLIQLDISEAISSGHQDSETRITEIPNGVSLDAFMLAINGKIYINTEKGKYLSTIHQPNKKGEACNFELKEIELPNGNGSGIRKDGFGLPLTPSGIFRNTISFERHCNNLIFTAENLGSSDSFYWQYRASDENLIESGQNPLQIKAKEAGKDSLRLIYHNNMGTDTIPYHFNVDTTYDLEGETTTRKFCPERTPMMLEARPDFNHYSWNKGVRRQTLEVKKPGTYWVDYELDSSCTLRDSFLVTKANAPSVSLSETDTLCKGDTLELSKEVIPENYEITFKQGEKAMANPMPVENFGTYVIKVSNGCSNSTDSFQITDENCGNCKIHVPNAFTPTGEGLNDVFKPVSNCLFKEFELQIFNRWGEEIYFSKDADESWDGSYKDQPAPLGVYLYQISGQFSSKRRFFKYGIVNLIK